MNKYKLKYRLIKYYKKFLYFSDKRKVKLFIKNGMKPWSRGYSEYRKQQIIKVLKNRDLLQKFKQSNQLPENYGFRLDERIIKYPYVLSRLPKKDLRILDAGSTFNFDFIIDNPIISNKDLFIITLSHESQCFYKKDISYIYNDLRDAPFKDNYFDIIVCISTLEHIGMNNSMYTSEKSFYEYKPRQFLKCIKEFNRILKPNGNLYITVPYGKYKNYGFFQSFDDELIKEIIETFKGSLDEKINYYQYLENGWILSKKDKCNNLMYFNMHDTKYFSKKSDKGYDKDFAAAARAVACMKFTKK